MQMHDHEPRARSGGVAKFMIDPTVQAARSLKLHIQYNQKRENNMTNIELVQGYFQSLDENKPELLDGILAADWKAIPGTAEGLGGQKKNVAFLNSRFENFSYKIKELIESKDGQTVVALAELGGIQVAEFLGIQPTNKKIAIDTVVVSRIKDGKIYETYHLENFMSAQKQLTAQ